MLFKGMARGGATTGIIVSTPYTVFDLPLPVSSASRLRVSTERGPSDTCTRYDDHDGDDDDDDDDDDDLTLLIAQSPETYPVVTKLKRGYHIKASPLEKTKKACTTVPAR